MRRVLISAALLAGLAGSGAVWAEDASPTPAPAAAVATAASDDEVVCKEEKVTGSLIGSRVCMTRRDWKQSSASGQNMLQGMQDKGAATEAPVH
jgi:hypothetical protein